MIETSTGSGGRRPDRVIRAILKGTGKVTPIRPVRLGLEVLEPGKARLIPDHDLVLRQPELFRPCDARDTRTAQAMRQLTRSHSGGHAKRPDPTNSYGLGSRNRNRPRGWEL